MKFKFLFQTFIFLYISICFSHVYSKMPIVLGNLEIGKKSVNNSTSIKKESMSNNNSKYDSVSPFKSKDIKNAKYETFVFKTFVDWKKACAKLRTKNRMTHGKLSQIVRQAKFKDTCVSKKEFKRALKKIIYVMKKGSFLNPKHWIDYDAPNISFLAIDEKPPNCMFFVQKIMVNPQAKIVIHADIHGDIHALIKYVNDLFLEHYIDNNFKITDKNVYLVFLGDYTDGWLYGVETLYTIMRLKIANPEQVILVRGNHEDIIQNRFHGFKKEFYKKFSYKRKEMAEKFSRLGILYNILPSAVYIGVPSKDKRFVNYLMFVHGGLEPRFNPHCLLADKRACVYEWFFRQDTSWFKGFNRSIYNKTISYDSCVKKIGFIWNDFIVDEKVKVPVMKSHRRYGGHYKFSKEITQKYLQSCSCNRYALRTIFRGHQHSHKLMYKKLFENHGICNMWSNYQWDGVSELKLADQNMVWILNVSPHAIKNIFFKRWPINFDIHAILKLDVDFRKWTLQPKKLECL